MIDIESEILIKITTVTLLLALLNLYVTNMDAENLQDSPFMKGSGKERSICFKKPKPIFRGQELISCPLFDALFLRGSRNKPG
ncbi:MAG: hypothetical protein J6U01_04375 [Clostridia bacterium]|nr:hypothetical protein [Clostridia bacterium]